MNIIIPIERDIALNYETVLNKYAEASVHIQVFHIVITFLV